MHFSAGCGIVYPLIYDFSKEVTRMKDIHPNYRREEKCLQGLSQMYYLPEEFHRCRKLHRLRKVRKTLSPEDCHPQGTTGSAESAGNTTVSGDQKGRRLVCAFLRIKEAAVHERLRKNGSSLLFQMPVGGAKHLRTDTMLLCLWHNVRCGFRRAGIHNTPPGCCI